MQKEVKKPIIHHQTIQFSSTFYIIQVTGPAHCCCHQIAICPAGHKHELPLKQKMLSSLMDSINQSLPHQTQQPSSAAAAASSKNFNWPVSPERKRKWVVVVKKEQGKKGQFPISHNLRPEDEIAFCEPSPPFSGMGFPFVGCPQQFYRRDKMGVQRVTYEVISQ